MPLYKGIIEDNKEYAQHNFQIEAPDKDEAEELAIEQLAKDEGEDVEIYSILVCVEVLTQDQADMYEKNRPQLPYENTDPDGGI